MSKSTHLTFVAAVTSIFLAAACGQGDTTRTVTVTQTVTVTREAGEELPPSTVSDDAEPLEVEKIGFSEGDTFVGYGALVNNTSERDAIQVAVIVTSFDASGAIIESRDEELPLVPSRVPYYLGGYLSARSGTPADRVDIVVKGAAFAQRAGRLPQVSEISFRAEDGVIAVSARLTNTLSIELSEFSAVRYVAFDQAGRIVGGGSGRTEARLKPGQAKLLRLYLHEINPQKVNRVEINVDPG